MSLEKLDHLYLGQKLDSLNHRQLRGGDKLVINRFKELCKGERLIQLGDISLSVNI